MNRRTVLGILFLLLTISANAQTVQKDSQVVKDEAKSKVYNEDINPLEQIDKAVAKAKAEGKFVTGVSGVCALLTS